MNNNMITSERYGSNINIPPDSSEQGVKEKVKQKSLLDNLIHGLHLLQKELAEKKAKVPADENSQSMFDWYNSKIAEVKEQITDLEKLALQS